MNVDGATAIVTGGASGIGRGVALALADAGADVVVGDLQEASPDDEQSTVTAIAEGGGNARYVQADVTEDDDAKTLVESALDWTGSVDILVNNAGIIHDGTVETTTEEDWNRTLDVNLTSIYRCSKHAIPALKESETGRIINIASQLGVVGRPEKAVYCASKGGVVNLTRQMALDYASEGITVNAICPGVIETDMTRTQLADEETRAEFAQHIPLPFVGQPEDIAQAAVFVASEAARYMTGHALVIDGGWTAQ